MKNKESKGFETLQKIGKSFFLPISLLPFVGILLGIGASFTNPANVANLGLESILYNGSFLNIVLKIFSGLGGVVFGNLPLLFAMAVALGLAKSEKATATFAAAVAFLSMHTVINVLLVTYGRILADGSLAANVPLGTITKVLGIQSLEMGVFGGIVVGLVTVWLHNKFYKIELPSALSFFGGTRFVPIVSIVAATVLGCFFFITWPYIQLGISQLGNIVVHSGYFGTFLFGVIERALIPFGLHHAFYIPIWQTGLGGSMEVAGQMYYGAQNIYFAQLADPSTTVFSIDACRFLVGKYPFMMGGLPAAALAMYHCVPKMRRKEVKGLYLGAGATSFLTGITEPIEFTFLFLSPLLFVIHVICAGISFLLCHILVICVGTTFSDGLIDFSIFGLLQGAGKTNWPILVLLIIGYAVVYYFVFKFLIKKWDIKVPGRDEESPTKLFTKEDYKNKKESSKEDSLSEAIVKGLGGLNNIKEIDCCATRLRVSVVSEQKVDDAILKATGANGVLHKGSAIQVIYGPRVTVIKSRVEEYIEQKTIELKEGLLTNEISNDEEICNVVTHMSGNLITLDKVKDDMFSQRMLGDGFAIEPSDGHVVSPVCGNIEMIFPTKHAMGIKTVQGQEILVHMGIDTVKLEGKGFEILVEIGQYVEAGDPIANMDLSLLKDNNIDPVVPVVFTEMKYISKIDVIEGTITAKESNRVILK
ncbi:MAG: glucose PTS transporter subunit IIA [Bacilli bacterium]